MSYLIADDKYLIIPGIQEEAIEYGLLYNWYAATDVRNISADGWYLPSKGDFSVLINYLGGWSNSGGKLKEIGTAFWDSPNTGATNESKFNARGSGQRSTDGVFSSFKQRCDMWCSSTAYGFPEIVIIGYDSIFMTQYGSDYSDAGKSIRLLKSNTTLSNGEEGTYTGNDGKVYRTICVSTQEWLADNLAETKYRNGDTIPEVIIDASWAALTTGALCAYNNDWDNVNMLSDVESMKYLVVPEIETEFEVYYGLLYNWYAATDVREITNDGWHVASCLDWSTLLELIDNYDSGNRDYPLAGGKLKETGYSYWNDPNTGATNEVFFNLRGAGTRNYLTGAFSSLLSHSWIWCSDSELYGTYVYFRYNGSNCYLGPATLPPGYPEAKYRTYGMSVRLVKDSTLLNDGETGTYTGNDNKVYRTICIGTQEWLADNLAETKYRNGDTIPEVTIDASWGALTTGAICAYDNSWGYAYAQ